MSLIEWLQHNSDCRLKTIRRHEFGWLARLRRKACGILFDEIHAELATTCLGVERSVAQTGAGNLEPYQIAYTLRDTPASWRKKSLKSK